MINLRKNDALADAVKDVLQQEALKGNQVKIDKNHNGKIDGQDFKILRGEKKAVKEEESVEEGVKEVAKKAFKVLTGGSDKDQLDALRKRMYKPEPAKKPSDKSLGEESEQIDEKLGGTQKMLNQTAHKSDDPMRRLKVTTDHPKFKDKPLNKTSQDVLKKRLKSAQGTHSKPNLPEEVEGLTLRQFMENAFDYKSPRKPEPNGGSGVKQGSRYGGSKQKDKPEQDTDTKK
jgi:hypothetical protein